MKQKWTNKEQLEEQYTISPEEYLLIKDTREKTSVPFALLLTYYRNEKRFPKSIDEVPKLISNYIYQQLKEQNSNKTIENFDFESRTASRFRTAIRDFFSFREATLEDEVLFEKWLISDKLNKEYILEILEDYGIEWFHKQKIESPSDKQINRIIRSAIKKWEENLFQTIYENMSDECKNEIEKILCMPEETILEVTNNDNLKKQKKVKSGFALIKSDPGRIGLDSVINEVEKFDILNKISIDENLFKQLIRKIIKKYKQRVSVETSHDLKSHPEKTRYALMSIYCFTKRQDVIDNIIDILIQLVHKISSGSQRKVDSELIADFKKKVSGKNQILFKISESSLENPASLIEDVIFPAVGKETLEALVKEFKEQGATYYEKVHYVLRDKYKSHYRRMIPMIFNRLDFRSNNEIHKPIIDGISLIKNHFDEKNRYFNIETESTLLSLLKKNLRNVVFQEEDDDGIGKINRISFEICLLQALRDGLRCREIWVVGANRYRNPEDDLPDNFEELRDEYLENLKLPKNSNDFIKSIKLELEKELRHLNKNMPYNNKVKILAKNKGWISLTPLDEQEEPKNLKIVQNEVFKRWKQTSLLDVLKETDLRTQFTEKFNTSGTKQYLDKETLQRRLLACIFSLGTNTGLTRVGSLIPGEQHHELVHVKKTYVSKDYLREAISSVVNATFEARQEKIWGHVTVSCASDSKKFGAWDQNLMVEHHIRYGGRGVMIYWHVEKKSMCIYSQLKSCSSSEVSAMIEGVLRHCSDMKVEKQFVDSHGQSEVAFAFTRLLGFQLMPRLRRIHVQKLYLPNNEIKSELTHLNHILTRKIDWDMIEQQYDQMAKYATALRLGTAETDSILKRFTRNGIKHPTYLAFAELGKAIKTIFLCRYLNSEELRQEIHEGLNVVERWNGINSFIFYGKSSEFSSNRLEEQELSVLTLHLLQASLVFINTLMIQEVLSEEYYFALMQKDDFRALTPLIHTHVNPYGKFILDMNLRIPLKENKAA